MRSINIITGWYRLHIPLWVYQSLSYVLCKFIINHISLVIDSHRYVRIYRLRWVTRSVVTYHMICIHRCESTITCMNLVIIITHRVRLLRWFWSLTVYLLNRESHLGKSTGKGDHEVVKLQINTVGILLRQVVLVLLLVLQVKSIL